MDVVEIFGPRRFSLVEASRLLPLVYRLTDDVSREVKNLVHCLETLPDKKSERARELEARVDGLIQRWQGKIQKLGAHPKGLWLVDFDHGDGYYCWKFPENSISYEHGYQDGFSGRKLLAKPGSPYDENRPRPDQPDPRGL